MEKKIYEDFRDHGLTIIGAIERLERIGYSAKDAEELVDEWVEALEPSGFPDGE